MPKITQLPAATALDGTEKIAVVQGGITKEASAAQVYGYRTITGTANQITVQFGDGVAGNPTISVPTNPQFPFLQTGTGAVSRSLSAKVGEIISVKDFGAACDNSTDDTAAIQAAINAAAVVGSGALYIPGVCKISSTLNIASGFITIFGGGRLVSGIRTTSATASIFNITASYTTIDSMSLTGTTGAIATAGSAINANGAQGCKFTNLYIADLYSGIDLNNSTSSIVSFVKVVDIYGPFGLKSENGGGDYIAFNQFDPIWYGTQTSSSGFGAWATSTSYALNDVRSANNGFFICTYAGTSSNSGTGPAITAFGTAVTDGTAQWKFLGSTSSVGILLANTSNSNYIAFNDISGVWSVAIQLNNTADGNRIIGNTIGQIIGLGVQLNLNGTDTLIEGNVFSDIYGQFGVAIDDTNSTSSGLQVVSNFIQNTGWHGIQIASANALVIGNNIKNVGVITGASGIDVVANTNNFTISDNVIQSGGGMSSSIKVEAGTSDYYNIIGNVIGSSGSISDGGTGTHKAVGTTMTLENNQTVAGIKTFIDGKMQLAGSSSGAGTLKAPAAASAYVWTLPTTTDTLIGKATTDTLTNKTFDTAGTGNSLSINGLAATANTGTGAVARATSPALVTPDIGVATGTTLTTTSRIVANYSASAELTSGITSLDYMHVHSADGAAASFVGTSYATNSFFILQRANGTAASKSAVSGGAQIGAITWKAWDGSVMQQGSSISSNAWAGFSGSDRSAYISFNVTAQSSTSLTERMRLSAAGGLSVGSAAVGTDAGEGAVLAGTTILSVGPTSGIGYATGAGGTVTQATSRTTGVTLNKVSGAITLFSQVNTAVSQATAQSFTVTNSAVAATDVVVVNQKSGTDKYEIFVTNVAAGSFQITNYAVAGTTNEAPVFNFAVIKGAAS